MARTSIDIDDELIARVMQRLGLQSTHGAVDAALRAAAGMDQRAVAQTRPSVAGLTEEDLLSTAGVGWDGDVAGS